jgi:hypothetical protein
MQCFLLIVQRFLFNAQNFLFKAQFLFPALMKHFEKRADSAEKFAHQSGGT